jgi:aspartate 1-decarboxylase
MEIQVLKSKIHRARVTEANLDYIGSITIDENLMDAANLIENEQVHVFNYRNGVMMPQSLRKMNSMSWPIWN